MINHIPNVFDMSLTKDRSNLRLLNDLEQLYKYCLRLNTNTQGIKQGYDKSVESVSSAGGIRSLEEALAHKNAMLEVNSYYKKHVELLMKDLKATKMKTEKSIALIDPCIQRATPNVIKYIFWFLTDWLFNISHSYSGFWTGPRYIKEEDLIKETNMAYIKFKVNQKEIMEIDKKEIEAIATLPL